MSGCTSTKEREQISDQAGNHQIHSDEEGRTWALPARAGERRVAAPAVPSRAGEGCTAAGAVRPGRAGEVRAPAAALPACAGEGRISAIAVPAHAGEGRAAADATPATPPRGEGARCCRCRAACPRRGGMGPKVWGTGACGGWGWRRMGEGV